MNVEIAIDRPDLEAAYGDRRGRVAHRSTGPQKRGPLVAREVTTTRGRAGARGLIYGAPPSVSDT